MTTYQEGIRYGQEAIGEETMVQAEKWLYDITIFVGPNTKEHWFSPIINNYGYVIFTYS